MGYNLLEEKWLPVLWRNGDVSRVGIIEALTQAHRIRQIAATNPMDRVAVLRFMLALIYWCKGNPPTGKILDNLFPPDWFKKLYDNKESFKLLGDKKRFYQCQPEPGKHEKLSANYLVQEVPTGTNFWHFRHSTDKTSGLCPACCAMGLLRMPAFATSGGRGKPPGINAKPPIYVIPLRLSLADTIRQSWQVSYSNLGKPAWETPDSHLPEEGVIPVLTGLTWLPRRVWLDDPEAPEAKCISCGRKDHLIRQCVFGGIGSTKSDGNRVWIDPHVIYDDKDVVKPSNALSAPHVAAGQWAKILAGVLRAQKPDVKGSLWVISFATVQNDKYLEAMEYEIPLACPPDDEKVMSILDRIELWQKEGSNLVHYSKPKGSSRKNIDVPPLLASIRPQVEGRVCAKAGKIIVGDEDTWAQAASEYSPMMGAIAKSLSPGYTTAALRRRKQIASTKPNMRQHPKTARKKGEDK